MSGGGEFLHIPDHWAQRGRGGFPLSEGIVLIYTITGDGGQGACFFCDGMLLGVAEKRRRREGSFLWLKR